MDLDELERLAKAATPGPWHYDPESSMLTRAPDGSPGPTGYEVMSCCNFDDETLAYIAAVEPETIIELVSMVRAERTVAKAPTRRWPPWWRLR